MRISLKYSGTKYYTLGGELLDYGLIAIYDTDSEYAHSLANYFRIKGCLSSEIVVFTRDTTFLEFVKDHSIDILLIEKEQLNTVDNLSLTKNLFILSNERKPTADNSIGHFIYKYSSAEDILRLTMASYEPEKIHSSIRFPKDKTSNIIGIYSPLSRCGKTSFSLALAIQYGMRSSCLYLSMDEVSTLRYLFEWNSMHSSFDKLLYYFLQSEDTIESKLLSIVKHMWGINIIPPFDKLSMFNQLSITDWCRFIKKLANIGKYQYIIIDIGGSSPVEPLLVLCDKVYIPTIDNDPYALDKINIFLEHLLPSDSENVSHIQTISLPYVSYTRNINDYLHQLTSGSMAKLTADIIEHDYMQEGLL